MQAAISRFEFSSPAVAKGHACSMGDDKPSFIDQDVHPWGDAKAGKPHRTTVVPSLHRDIRNLITAFRSSGLKC